MWSKSNKLPNQVCMWDAQAVSLGKKLYIGGGMTDSARGNCGELYVYLPDKDSWEVMDSPVFWFALAAYRSQLVLVGGVEANDDSENDNITGKIWTLCEDNQKPWHTILPPMGSPRRCNASAVGHEKYLLVAGGNDLERSFDTVEVYDGSKWMETHPLPHPCVSMKSTVFKGHWYLMGGYHQGREVYYASLDDLVESCHLGGATLSSWNQLPDVFFEYSSPAIFGRRLVAIGGQGSQAVYAYSPASRSWVAVGEMPINGISNTCAAVVHSGELTVIGGKQMLNLMYRISLEPQGEVHSCFGMNKVEAVS